jgi:hypothetical protein
MFLRKLHRTKDGKRHTYFALVESHRTERGPRQRVVAQLGELTEDQERRWQRTAVFHTRHEDVCVPAYALWKALAHMLRNARLQTRIRKKDPDDPDAGPQDRAMSPAVALKVLHDVQIGDILLETVEGRTLRLRRVARPNAEQAQIITALGFGLPERLCADRDVTPRKFPTDPPPGSAST